MSFQIKYYGNAEKDYPFDFDPGLNYVRYRSGIDYFPRPPVMNALSGLLPLQDGIVWNGAFGRTPYGPGSPTVGDAAFTQNIIANFNKFTPKV